MKPPPNQTQAAVAREVFWDECAQKTGVGGQSAAAARQEFKRHCKILHNFAQITDTINKAMSNSAPQNLEMEWTFAAPIADAWAALVYEIGIWWPGSMFCSDKAQEMVLEPSLGGRLYEDHGNGQGMVWYTVYTLIENERLELLGPVMPRWGGPSLSTLSLHLVSEGDHTVLKLTEGTVGAPINETELRDGWNKVFGSLQTYLAERSSA